MKVSVLILFIIALPMTLLGQTSSPPTPPGLVISEWRWSPYSNRLNRRHSSSITADDAASKARRDKNRQGSADEVSGNTSLPSAPDPFVIGPKELEGRPYGYVYKVTIENKGEKKIKAISWEYVFLDPIDYSVVARHPFSSKVNLKPGDKKMVSGLRARQRAQVVRAEAAGLPPLEQVIIKRVDYSDGTNWVQ